MRTNKWIAICEGMTSDHVCEWQDGEGTFGFCLEVHNPRVREKVAKSIGEVVVFSTIKSRTWEGHETLIGLRKATRKDFERYPSLLSSKEKGKE